MNVRSILTTSCLGAWLLIARAEAAEWEKLPPLPKPNGGFVCGVDHGKVVVAGGTYWEGGEKRWLPDVHLFDPAARQWTSVLSLSEPMAYGVSGHSKKGLVFGDAFVFAGGATGSSGFASQGWLEGHGHFILRQGLPADRPVVLAAGGMMDERLIFVGGTDEAANAAGFRRTAFALTPQGKVEPLPDCPGRPFGIAASAVEDGTLFIFGGAHWDEAAKAVMNTGDAFAFSWASKSWRGLKSFPYAVRGLSAVALGEGLIYLGGGFKNETEGFKDEAFLYDITKDEYRPARPLPYKAMVSLVVCDGHVYCLGGEDKQKSRTDACYRIPVAALLK